MQSAVLFYFKIVADLNAFVHSYSPVLLPFWIMKTILSLMLRIIMAEKSSLCFCFMMTLSTYLVTDSKLRPTIRFLWGVFHGICHIAAALFCVIFVECLTEWLLEEAIVKVPNVYRDGAINLASSLHHEYTIHFAPVFRGKMSHLMGSIDFSSPLLRILRIFDLPSRIAKNHSEMWYVLCALCSAKYI